MNTLIFRPITYSEFTLRAPTTRSRRMRAHQLASGLLRHGEQVRQTLPETRRPNYGEFKQLVGAVHGGSSQAVETRQVGVYDSLVDLHRRRMDRNFLKNIKSTLNTRLSPENRTNQLDYQHMNKGLETKQNILRNNMILLRRMNEIQRVQGRVDCFNSSFQLTRPSRHRIEQQAAVLSRENHRLGCRLLRVKSKVDSHNPWRTALSVTVSDPTEELVRKYSVYMPTPLPRKPVHSPREMLRPVIYFDLALHRGQHLGRICIQLYTEVSPEVVLEFVRLAIDNNVGAHKFQRVFPDLWMEGELLPHSRDALENHHDHPSPLDARQLKGVLSYSWSHRQSFPHGLLLYTISFKTLAVMPLKRVIFGRVLRGFRLLEICREFGTKGGKLKQCIEVVKCGLL
ncbi:uncharacterized protein LOC135429041 [Drosophila montana]|uniref:uncharacterized protein LOC135429041 n=1 Tax=Drosophila montana TaxID=40370 RepID=UPI00313F3773